VRRRSREGVGVALGDNCRMVPEEELADVGLELVGSFEILLIRKVRQGVDWSRSIRGFRLFAVCTLSLCCLDLNV
jgi:hypothetical protein